MSRTKTPNNDTESISSHPQEALKDWAIAFQLESEGKLDEYAGIFVVIYEGRVVASGKDSEKLRREMSDKLSVPSERLVIYLVEPGDYTLPRG